VTELSPVKRALLEIRELRARLAAMERASTEPIAIVGIGIRTPGGVRDLNGFANLLWSGKHGITTIPQSRWPMEKWYDELVESPGKMTTRFGGFIDDVDLFDAEFFGISPLEAASMDPQQRLLLELAWQALEDSGHAPSGIAGSSTGVYIGIANGDYGRGLFASPHLIDPYFGSGTAFSVAAGRLAYFLGVHGPAIAVDTACSSSLVALHLACQGLRQGECDRALAGGINLMLTPEIHINCSKAAMLARDGRCKTFDAGADGYVRSEGGAILVLRRLSDAVVEGDRILALIRGSAVNQDGRSNGMTAPNGPAQEAVVRAALKAARVDPASIGYVEAHGTGTPLGDPIELKALSAVMSPGRDPAHPLAVGSVKTNIGHLEAAAGIAGLIKAVLVLQRGEIPPHLNLQRPNPFIAWESMPIVVPTVTTPWQQQGTPRAAGVSSFGFSGTNVHVILEQAPTEPLQQPHAMKRGQHLLALSARDPAALETLTANFQQLLSSPAGTQVSLADLCFTANAGRTHFSQRLAVVGASTHEMSQALQAFSRREVHPGVVSGKVADSRPTVAFLFAGQGSQYAGMGRELYDSSPVFRDAFDRCADLLDPLLPKTLKSVIFESTDGGKLLDDTAFAQPALFAIEYALASLWMSWGVRPVAVLGHSLGEYAAACVAGVMSLPDTARIIAARGRLMQQLPRDGAMFVVEAGEQRVRAEIEHQSTTLAIAAVNGTSSTVISGERSAVEAAAARFAASGVRIKALRVSHAFHSPLMEPVLDRFEREMSGVAFAEPQMALVSNLSGQLATLKTIGHADYWRQHMRHTVRFADSMRTLAAQGVSHYIEISPQPVLLGVAAECVPNATWLPSLRDGTSAWSVLLHSLQSLYCAGASIDWCEFDRSYKRRRLALPTYPFQRKRHWMNLAPASAPVPAAASPPLWQQMSQALATQAQRGPLDLNVTSYAAKWSCLSELTSALAIQTLHAAGLFSRPAEHHSLEDVLTAAGIIAAHRHLMQRWLDRLTGLKILRKENGLYVADTPLKPPELHSLWSHAEQLFHDDSPLLAYVKNCAQLLDAVLTGKESPLETLFPGGSFELAEALYQRSATMRYINELAATVITAVVKSMSPGKILQVLEVGAGTGSTSTALLPLLPADRTRYLFSDMSPSFFEQARSRLGAYPFLQYGLFDMDRDPVAQGYALQSFDVIVSANCVHASTDLRTALRRLHSLLSPGGVLVLVESTIHHDWFDITTGLIEGWQKFADDLRTDNPLLPAATWIRALEEAGFQTAGAWPGRDSPAEVLGQHVIVAQVPGDPAAASAAAVTMPTYQAATGIETPPESPLSGWREMFDQAPIGDRLDVLQELVCMQVTRILRLEPGSRPRRNDRLMELGMDSLMAVQLRNALGAALKLDTPPPSTLMFDYPTVDAIASFLLTRLAPIETAPASNDAKFRGAAGRPAARDAAAVASMSDDEIARLLTEQLGTSQLGTS
jgi:acyl transferase domain-containing protein/SAM-dependent methyltransferase